MKKSYYIIIRGPLGCGKTTIAKKLTRLLKGKYISIDLLLEKLGLDNIEGECIPLKNFLKVNKNIIPEIKKKLNGGKIIIIDGNFYHKEQIKDLINKIKFEHFVFTLKAPILVCVERDDKRKRVYGKRAVKEVHKLVSTFDYGIVINTENKIENEVVDEIKERLK